MTQRTALILSVVLTAFVLVVGGGLIARLSQPQATAAASSSVAPPPAAATAPAIDLNAQMQELIQQREAQYRLLIDQANQRLAAMNQELSAAPAVVTSAQSAAPAPAAAPAVSTAPASPSGPQISLSAEAARNIAIQAANFATMIRTPELVRFEGQVAYEVGFTRGVVYVDANSGAVLFNGTQGHGGSSQPAAPSDQHEGEHEHEEEHETEHGEDHH
jgi:hypothetical protein